ncbi:unnamed protein product [Orchesella dallaii]|uniref:Shematrin-like protein 2 n=1 Tax=Orchesella dallaii TaxID=48710 RepID=A0ABP1QJJ1_9HEXA
MFSKVVSFHLKTLFLWIDTFSLFVYNFPSFFSSFQILLAVAFGIASAYPNPLLPPGAITTTTHHTTAAHQGYGGYGSYGGYGLGYPGAGSAVVKNTEVVSTGYPGLWSAYGAYPGIGGLGQMGGYYGYPSSKAVTHVQSTAVHPGGYYGYY